MKFRLSHSTIFIFYPTLLKKTTGPIFTVLSHNIEQLIELLMHVSTWWWCIMFQNKRAKSEYGQFWRLQKSPKINWLPYLTFLGLLWYLRQFYKPHTCLYQNWNVGEDRLSNCWDIKCDRPILAVSFQKYKFLTPQSLALLDQSLPYLYTMKRDHLRYSFAHPHCDIQLCF